MITDILIIAACFALLIALAALGAWTLSALFRAAKRAHPLAWIPLLGLLAITPWLFSSFGVA